MNKNFVTRSDLCKRFGVTAGTALKIALLLKLKPVLEVAQGPGMMAFYDRAAFDAITDEQITKAKYVTRHPTAQRSRAKQNGHAKGAPQNMVPNARHRMNNIEDRVTLLEQKLDRLLNALGGEK